MTLRTLNYGNYGIFLIMGNAGFCPSTVLMVGITFIWEFQGFFHRLGFQAFALQEGFKASKFRGCAFRV